MNKSSSRPKVEDNLCSICFELYFKPSKLPCGHYFCYYCLKKWIEHKTECPCCRARLSPSFRPKVSPFAKPTQS